ncbi:MAG: hypothetical protein AB8B99_18835 [Phormidesmis sp.]
MVRLKTLSSFIFLVLFQSFGLQVAAAPKADPLVPEQSSSTEQPSEPEFQTRELMEYMFGQKHTLFLGTDRGACGYHIDPTDVYAQGNTRYAIAVVTGSDWGNGCRGHLSFQIFQADCESNTLYAIERETEGDRRWRGWERFERTLSIDDGSPSLETSLDSIEQPPAEAICGLPLADVGVVEDALEPVSGD